MTPLDPPMTLHAFSRGQAWKFISTNGFELKYLHLLLLKIDDEPTITRIFVDEALLQYKTVYLVLISSRFQ